MTLTLYPSTLLPVGQQLWLKELKSYKTFPPLQAAATYNLDQVLAEVKANTHGGQGAGIVAGAGSIAAGACLHSGGVRNAP